MLTSLRAPQADALFQPSRARPRRGVPPTKSAPQDAVQQAVTNARHRWPALRDSLTTAATLVETRAVCEVPDVLPTLALCRPAGAHHGQLVALTASGFRCNCPAWPPASRAGPGDGLYCADILAALLAVYLDQRYPTNRENATLRPWLAPLPYTPPMLWEQALVELRRQLPRAAFTSWLAGSEVVAEASTPLRLTVTVRSPYAQEWLSRRLHEVVSRTVGDVAGYQVIVAYVCALNACT